jgi:hypothetical protein
VTRKYPLDPLRRVREENVDQKARALSDSLRKVETARDEAERIERRKRALENELAATGEAERQRLTRGELTAADLARGAAWVRATQTSRDEQARAAGEARTKHLAAEAFACGRRRDLAEAQASAELVAKHHERWQHARTAESVARDEEDAAEARSGRRGAR